MNNNQITYCLCDGCPARLFCFAPYVSCPGSVVGSSHCLWGHYLLSTFSWQLPIVISISCLAVRKNISSLADKGSIDWYGFVAYFDVAAPILIRPVTVSILGMITVINSRVPVLGILLLRNPRITFQNQHGANIGGGGVYWNKHGCVMGSVMQREGSGLFS